MKTDSAKNEFHTCCHLNAAIGMKTDCAETNDFHDCCHINVAIGMKTDSSGKYFFIPTVT